MQNDYVLRSDIYKAIPEAAADAFQNCSRCTLLDNKELLCLMFDEVYTIFFK